MDKLKKGKGLIEQIEELNSKFDPVKNPLTLKDIEDAIEREGKRLLDSTSSPTFFGANALLICPDDFFIEFWNSDMTVMCSLEGKELIEKRAKELKLIK